MKDGRWTRWWTMAEEVAQPNERTMAATNDVTMEDIGQMGRPTAASSGYGMQPLESTATSTLSMRGMTVRRTAHIVMVMAAEGVGMQAGEGGG